MSDHPIRVMVVDDSVVIRKVVTDVLSEDPAIEVVGAAANGKIAMSKLASLQPDLITLDVEMPEMDGLETLRAIRATGSKVPIIMFSTLTARGASSTMDALLSGANDYVTKPANVGSMQAALAAVRSDLLPRVRNLAAKYRSSTATRSAAAPTRTTVRPAAPSAPSASTSAAALRRGTQPTAIPSLTRPTRPAARQRTQRVDLVAIGVSTGGPNALNEMLPALPGDLPVPMVIVQHMPPMFTRYLAERLDKHTSLRVREAEGGELARPGDVWIAPGGSHLIVDRHPRGPVLRLSMDPPENSCRPAVDVLFRSAAAAYGAGVLAVVMTGMGYDGRAGARVVRDSGGRVIAQDEESSVVWGMPGAVTQAGLADTVLPLNELAEEINRASRWPYEAAGARGVS